MNWETAAQNCATAIQKRRQQLNRTQAEVARRAGLNRRVVGEVERGKTTVRWDVVLRIAAAVGLDLDLRFRSYDPGSPDSTEPWY